MKKDIKYCVIGAGNGGIAMAGYLAMMGYSVNLYNRTAEKLLPLFKNKTISLTGEVTGLGKLNIVTADIEKAVKNTDIIMVTVPAIGHSYIAEEMAPYLKDGQIIVLNPGRTGGALEVYETLLRKRKRNNIIVAEAQTFIYAVRAEDARHAHIFKTKHEVSLAAIPATKTDDVLEILNQIYPQFIKAKDILETSINNYGAIFHPCPTLLNSGHIERGIPFDYYTDGITPSVAKVLEKIDNERMAIGNKLQIDTISANTWLAESYGASGSSLYESIQSTTAYRGLKAPGTLKTRYIYEDVPYSLVPMESMGELLGVRTPGISSIIDIAESITGEEFRKTGRTADKLGLQGLSVAEMHLLARKGTISKNRSFVEEVM